MKYYTKRATSAHPRFPQEMPPELARMLAEHHHRQRGAQRKPAQRNDHMTWRGIYYTFIAALLLAAVLVAGMWVYVQLGGGAK